MTPRSLKKHHIGSIGSASLLVAAAAFLICLANTLAVVGSESPHMTADFFRIVWLVLLLASVLGGATAVVVGKRRDGQVLMAMTPALIMGLFAVLGVAGNTIIEVIVIMAV